MGEEQNSPVIKHSLNLVVFLLPHVPEVYKVKFDCVTLQVSSGSSGTILATHQFQVDTNNT